MMKLILSLVFTLFSISSMASSTNRVQVKLSQVEWSSLNHAQKTTLITDLKLFMKNLEKVSNHSLVPW